MSRLQKYNDLAARLTPSLLNFRAFGFRFGFIFCFARKRFDVVSIQTKLLYSVLMKRVAGRVIGMFVMAMLILGIINLVG